MPVEDGIMQHMNNKTVQCKTEYVGIDTHTYIFCVPLSDATVQAIGKDMFA